MGFIHVFEYLGGLAVFGIVYWLLDGIKSSISVATSHSGDISDLYYYIWAGVVIIYLLFGGIWLARKYAEDQYHTGGR